jgi:FMN phosphatase YigB (HAD superfamily)
MSNKVVLLDYDGVVLRNRVADISVAKRAGIFTWKTVNKHLSRGQKPISVTQGNDLCYSLYKGYGHTVTGLKELGYNVHLSDYNHFVYSTINYTKVKAHNNPMCDTKRLIQTCKEKNIELMMFSNAPYTWFKNTMFDSDVNEILTDIPDIREVLGISENDESYLKPSEKIFDVIGYEFHGKQIVFIDDNLMNMKHSIHNAQWKNVFVTSCNVHLNDNLHAVDSIDSAIEML